MGILGFQKHVLKLLQDNNEVADLYSINGFPSFYPKAKLQINSIKEEICEDCPSAWIGLQVAFSAFQEERLNTHPNQYRKMPQHSHPWNDGSSSDRNAETLPIK